MTSRRQLLQTSGLYGLLGLSGLPLINGCQSETSNTNSLAIGGFNKSNHRYGVASVNSNLDIAWEFECTARVHDIAVDNSLNIGAVAARRPGQFIQLFSPKDGIKLDLIEAPSGYQYEGHLCFLNQELWATASKEDSSEGVLIRYQLDQLSAPASMIELPGLGPHQLLSMDDHHLWVAIGGWHTANREILNSAGFHSMLALVNTNTGEVKTWDSPDPALSIRHLSLYKNNLTVAMQYPIPKPTDAPLIYQFTQDKVWSPLTEPDNGWGIFRGYIASVAMSDGWIAATSPQGHQAALWRQDGKKFIGKRSLMDAGGAAAINGRVWMSSGTGQLLVNTLENKQSTGIHWDNHWTVYNPVVGHKGLKS